MMYDYSILPLAYESIHKEKGHYQALSISRKNVLALVPQVICFGWFSPGILNW